MCAQQESLKKRILPKLALPPMVASDVIPQVPDTPLVRIPAIVTGFICAIDIQLFSQKRTTAGFPKDAEDNMFRRVASLVRFLV